VLRESPYYTAQELGELGLRSFGADVLVSRRASLYGLDHIALGDHVRVDDFVVLAAGSEGHIDLGDHVHVSSHACLHGGGGIVVEDFVSISGRSSLYSVSDDYSGEFLVNPTVPDRYTHVTRAPVTVERHVVLGAGTIVLPGVRVGEGCATGALTLVKHDLEPWGIYAGVPARLVRARSRRLLELEAEMVGSSGGEPDEPSAGESGPGLRPAGGR
jgi:galactoside O-acetyltransferase